MALEEVKETVRQSSGIQQLASCTFEAGTSITVEEASGSLNAFLIQILSESKGGSILCLTTNPDDARYLKSDIEQISESTEIVLFPPSSASPYETGKMPDPTARVERSDVLQQLAEGFNGIVVASLEAALEKVPAPEQLQGETMTVEISEEYAPEELVDLLVSQGFSHVDFVAEPGELALRGGILDVYPFAGSYPIRIEFFGDEIDSIREFDPQTQRSISKLRVARLTPNLEDNSSEGVRRVPFNAYFPDDALLCTFDENHLVEIAAGLYEEAQEAFEELIREEPSRSDELSPPGDRFLTAKELTTMIRNHPRLRFGTFKGQNGHAVVPLGGAPQPSFNASMKLVREQLQHNVDRGMRTHILCDSQSQASRLRDLLEVEIDRGMARLVVESLHQGFELAEQGLAVYTDHQIFNRYHRPTARKSKRYAGGLSLRELKNLNPGDFVVHVDHGIGKYAGLRKITVRGKQQEAVRVLFKDDDVLYVNVNALHKLNKYTGKEGHQPRLTKLGGDEWERTKSRTRSKVKDIARDLIKLYAERKASDGYAFSKDTLWQREMEASFEFEDTPDQARAAQEVKEDMEQPVPMDRLVCGDVGFGKTEVAIRAAFKAVQDGKQVAILVPTTILAQQHYETFRRRLSNYPVNIDVMSRFRSQAEQTSIKKRLKNGKVDILVGTHRITSKDIEFNDLGLLVIDEEQRFGVAAKERLRKIRADVDTLTLTATPIPRTLQYSLMGARDLSIISTPPANRQPIITEIHTFDKELIRDAILYEKSRGGQVFFIHNRVKTINELATMIRNLVPGVRVRVGHGQMRGQQLEDVMVGFINKDYDVLVSTTIIENGLDISNANTMIINRADRFGLSEMHQLRGRVGRSERKAFCYLLVPSIQVLTNAGRQRLRAIEEFSDLGSGFNIAMRDLDIRGAGSLLNAEQSGFIEDVGYETYHRILDDAIRELRADEFSDVFDEKDTPPPAVDTQVDVEADALIPESYISNNTERLNLYRRISEAGHETALSDIREEMDDRFGTPPTEVDDLVSAMVLRIRAQKLRLNRILYKNERLFLYLPTQEEDPYFYEEVFHNLLEQLANLDREYVMKDTKTGALRAIVQDVPTLGSGCDVMSHLSEVFSGAVPA